MKREIVLVANKMNFGAAMKEFARNIQLLVGKNARLLCILCSAITKRNVLLVQKPIVGVYSNKDVFIQNLRLATVRATVSVFDFVLSQKPVT